MKLPKFLKKYFWDVDFENIDFKKNQDFIIVRILEYGNAKALVWLFKNVSKNKIKEQVLESPSFSGKTINFWALFFNLTKNKIRCLNKPYQKLQKSHWPY